MNALLKIILTAKEKLNTANEESNKSLNKIFDTLTVILSNPVDLHKLAAEAIFEDARVCPKTMETPTSHENEETETVLLEVKGTISISLPKDIAEQLNEDWIDWKKKYIPLNLQELDNVLVRVYPYSL